MTRQEPLDQFNPNRVYASLICGNVEVSIPITSGMLQGSVIGSLKFAAFMNNLTTGINSNIRLFADVSIIYMK